MKIPLWLHNSMPRIGYEEWTIRAYEMGKLNLLGMPLEERKVFEK